MSDVPDASYVLSASQQQELDDKKVGAGPCHTHAARPPCHTLHVAAYVRVLVWMLTAL